MICGSSKIHIGNAVSQTPPSVSAHLDLGEIHLGVLFLKLLQGVQLGLLLARRLAHLLLALIPHHLLDHGPGFAVQVAQLAILGRDLGGVDLVGRVAHDAGPPFHLVAFVQVDADFFAARRRRGFERPGGFVHEDGVGEGTLWKAREMSTLVEDFSLPQN